MAEKKRTKWVNWQCVVWEACLILFFLCVYAGFFLNSPLHGPGKDLFDYPNSCNGD